MKPLRILLVEDDLSIGALLSEILDDMGHDVCSLETTQAGAVSAALQQRPDLMIVDAHLGSGSGIDAVGAICDKMPVPHIFMSGDRIAVAGPLAVVLQKPFTQQALAQAIERAVHAPR